MALALLLSTIIEFWWVKTRHHHKAWVFARLGDLPQDNMRAQHFADFWSILVETQHAAPHTASLVFEHGLARQRSVMCLLCIAPSPCF